MSYESKAASSRGARAVHLITGGLLPWSDKDQSWAIVEVKYRGRWVRALDAVLKILDAPEWHGGSWEIRGAEVVYRRGAACLTLSGAALRQFIEREFLKKKALCEL